MTVYPQMDIYLSTNQDQCRVTLLISTLMLPPGQSHTRDSYAYIADVFAFSSYFTVLIYPSLIPILLEGCLACYPRQK